MTAVANLNFSKGEGEFDKICPKAMANLDYFTTINLLPAIQSVSYSSFPVYSKHNKSVNFLPLESYLSEPRLHSSSWLQDF